MFAGLVTWLGACTDSSSGDATYLCDVYFGIYTNQPTPNTVFNIVAVDGTGATLACEKSPELQQQAINATGSDKLDCVCTTSSD